MDELNPVTIQKDRRRKGQTVLFAMFLVMFSAGLALKGEAQAVAIVVPLVIVLVVGIQWWIVLRERSREAARRAAGQPPSWLATLPVWAARETGAALPSGLQPGQDLYGRLRVEPEGITWIPSPRLTRNLSQPLTWRSPREASVKPTWGFVPLAYVHVEDSAGTQADLLVWDPRDLADVLDHWVGGREERRAS